MGLQTLIEMLKLRGEETAVSLAYTFQNEPRTYAQLWQSVQQFAAHLQQLDLQRYDRVVMALPNGHDFFAAFYGTQLAGGIAVPIFPGYSADRVLTMVELCGAKIVVLPTDEQFDASADGLTFCTVADSELAQPSHPFPDVLPDDLAYLQYTSGSTGNPKGVQLTHRQLLTNCRQMIAGMEITTSDIFVSWLPVYHDMGLVLMTMVPFYLGVPTHLLPTTLGRIQQWAEAIAQHGATFTAAPDFAYRLLVRRLQKGVAIDLSSLRVALNAAEPVRASTIEDFQALFGLKNVMVAGYGLAEATVGVSMAKPCTLPMVDERGFVSVGRPFPDVNITIVQNNEPVPVGEIGEIAISSPAVTSGYFGNPEATRALFWDAPLSGTVAPSPSPSQREGDLASPPLGEIGVGVRAILSGDLGYLDEDGRLFIVGRRKNVMIQGGETVYAAEVEEVVLGITAVRQAAAVGIDEGRIDGERVTVFVEARVNKTAYQDLVIDIIQAFQARFGFRPGAVYLLKAKTIPKTYNGKLQHQQLKEMFVSGGLRENGRILFPNY